MNNSKMMGILDFEIEYISEMGGRGIARWFDWLVGKERRKKIAKQTKTKTKKQKKEKAARRPRRAGRTSLLQLFFNDQIE